MGKRKRTYNINLIKKTVSYSTFEIAELFGIHKATARHWFKEGLKKIDDKRPYIVRGSDLKEFIKNRQTKNKRKCNPDELPCFKCRKPRNPKKMQVILEIKSNKIGRIVGLCCECGTKMFKAISMKNIHSIKQIYEIIKTQQKDLIESDSSVINTNLKKESLK